MEKRQIDNSQKALELYSQGAQAWKAGDRAAAMSLYAQSAELDPDGPGAHALEFTQDIMNFFDPNQLNP